MSRILLLVVCAWLAAPAAGHGQSVPLAGSAAAPAAGHAQAPPPEIAAALTDLAGDDADRREAAVKAIGATADPKWLAFLGSLREGSVYARKGALVVGGEKSTRGDQEVIEIFAAYDRAPLGAVPLADLTEVGADRRLRLAIQPFLSTGHSQARPADADPAARQRAERWSLLSTSLETLFQGASLASILLLMALGLAIVFGLMGVINMAHGELMALGAYATFVVQNWFRAAAPQWLDAYFLVALPASFVVAATVGVVLERGVIRHLYGRPLETLLLTWGASLIIQQGLRLWFGAANVDVASPRWLSGGLSVMAGLTLPWNRLFIIALAALSVATMYWLLFRTDAGLRIRAVTQNRSMSSCLGVRAGAVDALTFAIGAGLAGLAGCALTQIGNVGPSLGQNYIVDSFMVVVTGGVGKLVGTLLAAVGIGELNKVIEPALGAVFAKVAILVAVILFLQRRPAGLFAAKGRNAEA